MSAQALLTAFGDCSLSTEDLRGVEPQELYHFEGGADAAFCGLGELKDPRLVLLPVGL